MKNKKIIFFTLIFFALIVISITITLLLVNKNSDKTNKNTIPDTYQTIAMTNALKEYKKNNEIKNLTDVIKALKSKNLLSKITNHPEENKYVWDTSTDIILYTDTSDNVLSQETNYGDKSNWVTITYEEPDKTKDSKEENFDDIFS